MGTKKKDEVETPATPTLLWNERGQIGCELPGHAPHKGSDTWRFEHWKKIPPGEFRKEGSTVFGLRDTALACEVCKAGGRASDDATTKQDEAAPVEDAPKKKVKKTDTTLSDLSEKYMRHMENAGKSNGTCFSYKLELATAISALGADTKLADLTPEKVALYFGCARVNKKKNGKVKSPLSISKTQRVLRLALVWAEGAKLIAKAPLPENLATH
jgi:hypothetical protein